IQVALRGRCWSNAGCLVGKTDVQRIAIDVAVNSDCLDSHLLAGPDNATGNLAAVCDQDLFELARIESHKKPATKKHKTHKMFLVPFVPFCDLTANTKEWLAVLNRLAVLDVNLDYFTRGFRLNLVHEFHGFDNADNCVLLDVAANLHERIGVWRRRAIER